MVTLLLALTFGTLAAVAARSRGRNSLGWFIAGMLVGPFALVVALLPLAAREGLTLSCPRCAEVVRQEARICRHCGEILLADDARASYPLPSDAIPPGYRPVARRHEERAART